MYHSAGSYYGSYPNYGYGYDGDHYGAMLMNLQEMPQESSLVNLGELTTKPALQAFYVQTPNGPVNIYDYTDEELENMDWWSDLGHNIQHGLNDIGGKVNDFANKAADGINNAVNGVQTAIHNAE